MKKLTALLLFAAAAAMADVNFTYMIEAPPANLPGVIPGHDGILVLIKNPVSHAKVCATYRTSDGATRSACLDTDVNTSTYEYSGVLMDLRANSGTEFQIESLSVTVGNTTKTVPQPAPGVEY